MLALDRVVFVQARLAPLIELNSKAFITLAFRFRSLNLHVVCAWALQRGASCLRRRELRIVANQHFARLESCAKRRSNFKAQIVKTKRSTELLLLDNQIAEKLARHFNRATQIA